MLILMMMLVMLIMMLMMTLLMMLILDISRFGIFLQKYIQFKSTKIFSTKHSMHLQYFNVTLLVDFDQLVKYRIYYKHLIGWGSRFKFNVDFKVCNFLQVVMVFDCSILGDRVMGVIK